MGWYRMDENFVENAKVQKLKHPAFRLHVAALGYCSRNLTDGYISPLALKVLAAILEFPVKRHLDQLIEVGLWEADVAVGGHWINDYLIYNPDAETVKKIRDERSSAGKKGADKRWGDGNSDSKRQRQTPKQKPWQTPDSTEQKQDVTDLLKSRGEDTAEPAFEELEHSVRRLLSVLADADSGTEAQVRLRVAQYALAPADVEEAREAALSDSAKSPCGVAMSVLKARGEQKQKRSKEAA